MTRASVVDPSARGAAAKSAALVQEVTATIEELVSVLRASDGTPDGRLAALRALDLAHHVWSGRALLVGPAVVTARDPAECIRIAARCGPLLNELRRIARAIASPAMTAGPRRDQMRPVEKIDRALDDARTPRIARLCLIECVHAAVVDVDELYRMTHRSPPWSGDRRGGVDPVDIDAVRFVTWRFGTVFPEYAGQLVGLEPGITSAIASWRAWRPRTQAKDERWESLQSLLLAGGFGQPERAGKAATLRHEFSSNRRAIDARSAHFRFMATEFLLTDLHRDRALQTPARLFERLVDSPRTVHLLDPALPHELLPLHAHAPRGRLLWIRDDRTRVKMPV